MEANEETCIVMIERKDSISYIEFLRGKYSSIYNLEYLNLLFSRFTNIEKKEILKHDFNTLWENLWIHTDTINKNVRREYKTSSEKFNKLKKGFILRNESISLESLISSVTTNYEMNEWEIPKGRRISKESNKNCAIREFMEETNIPSSDYKIYKNIAPLIEEYRGINTIPYKHVYYIGKINEKIELKIDCENKDQYTEIKNIKWVTKKEATELIRDHDNHKRNIVDDIFTFIENKQNHLIL